MATLEELFSNRALRNRTGVTLLGDPAALARTQAIVSASPTLQSGATGGALRALESRAAEQAPIDTTADDQLRELGRLEEALLQAQFGPSAQAGTEEFRMNRLRMADPSTLSPQQQREQFLLNLGEGQAGQEFRSRFGLANPEKEIDSALRVTRIPGQRVGVAEQLSQGPGGIQFGAQSGVFLPSERRKRFGGGGFFGAIGQFSPEIRRAGAGALGAALGLSTLNPVLGAGLAARGALTGQAPTGLDLATALALPHTGLGVLGTLPLGTLAETSLSLLPTLGVVGGGINAALNPPEINRFSQPVPSSENRVGSVDFSDEELNNLSNEEIEQLIRLLEAS